MAAKKSTDVMIAGKVYTLSGYEEEGYLQHVASYINTKISEITERDEYRRIPNDMKSILIQLNIADDFFKAKKQFEAAEENYKKAEKDLFELKHELVDTQMKVEELLEKLNRERMERNQKSGRESQLEESYQKLEEKYQLLAGNAKVAEERNRQFEEMLRLTQQEKREVEAVNKELRLNKEKLEATLADALLGAASTAAPQKTAEAESEKTDAAGKKTDETKQPEPFEEEREDYLTPTELSKEEVTQLREAIHETMAELSNETELSKNQEEQDKNQTTDTKDETSDSAKEKDATRKEDAQTESDDSVWVDADKAIVSAKKTDEAVSGGSTQQEERKEADIIEPSGAQGMEQITAAEPKEDMGESISEKPSEKIQDADTEPSAETEPASAMEEFTDTFREAEAFPDRMEQLREDPPEGVHVTSKSSILLTPGLSEEELTELLGPIREPQPAMPELSKEELEELLAPAARHELTDEGPIPEPDDEEEFVSSVMSEITDDDDPEIKALAKQIAELERQEQAEKFKKKSKKGKKRKR